MNCRGSNLSTMNSYRQFRCAVPILSRSIMARSIARSCARTRQISSQSNPSHKSPDFNPLDTLRNRKRLEASIADDKKQFNRLTVAVVLCMMVTAGIVFSIDPLPPKDAKVKGAESQGDSKSSSGSGLWPTLKSESPKGADETFQG
jgi:hypothetical protein